MSVVEEIKFIVDRGALQIMLAMRLRLRYLNFTPKFALIPFGIQSDNAMVLHSFWASHDCFCYDTIRLSRSLLHCHPIIFGQLRIPTIRALSKSSISTPHHWRCSTVFKLPTPASCAFVISFCPSILVSIRLAVSELLHQQLDSKKSSSRTPYASQTPLWTEYRKVSIL